MRSGLGGEPRALHPGETILTRGMSSRAVRDARCRIRID
jgi:hypothetical protein